ncbi:MAG: hypothetical protein IRY85_16245 [Micromonosporaceae bacterium]|nr:hypothetical protein [Micromonosporaceae bacterium]
MTDPDQASKQRAARQREGMPRWVIGFIIAGVVVVALVVVLLALGHGPRQHMSSPAARPTFAVSPVDRS